MPMAGFGPETPGIAIPPNDERPPPFMLNAGVKGILAPKPNESRRGPHEQAGSGKIETRDPINNLPTIPRLYIN
jgi:hypothetical protein